MAQSSASAERRLPSVYVWTLKETVLEQVRKLSDALGTGLPPENFQVARIERMSNSEAFADVVICNSVLHFARDDNHFRAMLAELWRVLRPGGMLFCRLGSRIGMEFE